MGDPVVRIVLFPRPTAIWGTTTVYTEPFRASDFSQAIVTAWRGTGMGLNPDEATAAVIIEQSADGVEWFQVGDLLTPDANDEDTDAFDLDLEWFRAGATVAGDVPGTTIWATAAFVPRVAAAS